MKLVAHVAKRFRDRGIPYSDLMQEGFCGLLEAIDRFDLAHQDETGDLCDLVDPPGHAAGRGRRGLIRSG